MTIDGVKIKVMELEERLNVTFPQLYFDFLSRIDDGDMFEINNSGICFYSYSDLEERNQTYKINEYEHNYFMIGQGGDLAYFIKIDMADDNSIFSNDLGAVGLLEMKKEANSILDFIEKIQCNQI